MQNKPQKQRAACLKRTTATAKDASTRPEKQRRRSRFVPNVYRLEQKYLHTRSTPKNQNNRPRHQCGSHLISSKALAAATFLPKQKWPGSATTYALYTSCKLELVDPMLNKGSLSSDASELFVPPHSYGGGNKTKRSPDGRRGKRNQFHDLAPETLSTVTREKNSGPLGQNESHTEQVRVFRPVNFRTWETLSADITFRSDGVSGQLFRGSAGHDFPPFPESLGVQLSFSRGQSGCGAASRGARVGGSGGGWEAGWLPGLEFCRSFPAPSRSSARRGKKKTFHS